MNNHTPGPWHAEQDHDGYWNVVCNQDGFNRFIVGNEGLYRCDGQDEANARLITAAPELLEAAKSIEENAEERLNEYNELAIIISLDDYHAICDAIAKAKGKT